MSLTEKFGVIAPANGGLPCRISIILDEMSETDRDSLNFVMFEQVMANGKRLSNTQIYQVLLEEGYALTPFSVAQHRRKQCRCFVSVFKGDK